MTAPPQKTRARLLCALGLVAIAPPAGFFYLGQNRLGLIYFVLAFGALLLATIAPLVYLSLSVISLVHVLLLSYFDQMQIGKRSFPGLRGALMGILLLLVSVVLTRGFLIDVSRVTSDSMLPVLRTNDLLLVKKWPPRNMRHGALYLINFKDKEGSYVKRLIGLPGDTVTMRGNHVSLNYKPITELEPLNGRELFRERIKETHYQIMDRYNITRRFSRHFPLGQNEFFFIGDNRSNSSDSRIYGAIGIDDVVGEILFHFTPRRG
ncbi:MAG: signal peptidase I [Pseudomonadota bacterium]